MKVFVTGSTGFIGRHLAGRLVKEGFEVICTGRSLERLGLLSDKVKSVYLDIEDKEAVRKILGYEKPDLLFHCAGLVESSSLKKLRRANVEGTENVLQACLREGVKKVVYLSTIAVIIGNTEVPLIEELPYLATNHYGQSKIEAEEVALDYQQKGLKVAILRPPMVYGEGEPHLLPLLINLIRWRLLPILGDGSNKLHLVGVENLVDVMILSLRNEEAYHGTYIVADKEILSIKEIFEYIAEVLQVKPPFHISGALVPFFTHLPFAGKQFGLLLKDRVYSIERLQKRLGYTPRVSVYEGLKKAVLSYKNKG